MSLPPLVYIGDSFYLGFPDTEDPKSLLTLTCQGKGSHSTFFFSPDEARRLAEAILANVGSGVTDTIDPEVIANVKGPTHVA